MSNETSGIRRTNIILLFLSVVGVVIIAAVLIFITVGTGSVWIRESREEYAASAQTEIQGYIDYRHGRIENHIEWSRGLLEDHINWSRGLWENRITQNPPQAENAEPEPEPEPNEPDVATQEQSEQHNSTPQDNPKNWIDEHVQQSGEQLENHVNQSRDFLDNLIGKDD